jgi:WhiB family redox-sensing transcriptional regulator
MSASTVPRQTFPCHVGDPNLWFAETPADLEQAKTLCASCPVRLQCLAAALERAEPWGVWGGEILDRGLVVSYKRPRGRPRKGAVAA